MSKSISSSRQCPPIRLQTWVNCGSKFINCFDLPRSVFATLDRVVLKKPQLSEEVIKRNGAVLEAVRAQVKHFPNHVPRTSVGTQGWSKHTKDKRIADDSSKRPIPGLFDSASPIEVERVLVKHGDTNESLVKLSRCLRQGSIATVSLLKDGLLRLKYVGLAAGSVVLDIMPDSVRSITMHSAVEFVMDPAKLPQPLRSEPCQSVLLVLRHVEREELLGRLGKSSEWGKMFDLTASFKELIGLSAGSIDYLKAKLVALNIAEDLRKEALKRAGVSDNGSYDPLLPLEGNRWLTSSVIMEFMSYLNVLYKQNRVFFENDVLFQCFMPVDRPNGRRNAAFNYENIPEDCKLVDQSECLFRRSVGGLRRLSVVACSVGASSLVPSERRRLFRRSVGGMCRSSVGAFPPERRRLFRPSVATV